MMANKAELQAALIAQLAVALDAALAAHAAALEGATHTEARAENDKDTRGLEQSYLARGQAQRVAELEAGIAAVTALVLRDFAAGAPIALGAVVTVDEDAERKRLFIAPHGGGSVLAGGGGVVALGGGVVAGGGGVVAGGGGVAAGGGGVVAGGVQVVTPASPLGRALLGKRVDDEVEVRLPGKLRTLRVVDVA
jgi:GreA/GreB family transcription elongation factor